MESDTDKKLNDGLYKLKCQMEYILDLVDNCERDPDSTTNTYCLKRDLSNFLRDY